MTFEQSAAFYNLCGLDEGQERTDHRNYFLSPLPLPRIQLWNKLDELALFTIFFSVNV